ncbi:MAG: hypothetical protein QOI14_906 [Actinomycetota bacterium]|nr:hypothetical protein [Actinomycetota bacterium]
MSYLIEVVDAEFGTDVAILNAGQSEVEDSPGPRSRPPFRATSTRVRNQIPQRSHQRVVSAGVAVVLVGVLSACTPLGVAGPHDYDAVNQAAKSLHLSKYGHVVYTGHYGSAHRIEGSPPTVIKVVLGDSATYASLLAALPEDGYQPDGADEWLLKYGKSSIDLRVLELKSGGTYNDIDGKSHAAKAPGAYLSMNSSG